LRNDKTIGGKRIQQKVVEINEVNNGIESVREYVLTTRKYGKVWHQCKWNGCRYGSKWSGAMVNHCRSHLGIKPFMCDNCGKLFTISCNLKNHLRVHHGVKAKIVSHNNRRKKRHNKEVNEEEEKQFEQVDNYQKNTNHVKSDSQLSDQVMTSPKLRIFKPSFVNGYDGDNPYATQTRSANSQRIVINSRRIGINTRRLGMKYKSRRSHRNSRYVKDEDGVEEYEEEEEEKEEEVEDKMDYEEGEEVHAEDDVEEDIAKFITKRKYNRKLWYKCIWNQCKYQSYRRSALVFHVKKHMNFRPYKCNWPHCDASFIQKFQLMTHLLVHKGEKPYKCNFPNCMFSTVRAGALKIHKIRHTGVKRFVCNVRNCRAKFSVKVSLIRHLRVHSSTNFR